MIIFLTILLILSVLVEGTITMLPLTLVCLICFTILKRDTSVFPLAFVAGLFIDIFRVQAVGVTSIFYLCFLFLILLYQKKYEIYSAPFVMMATLFGSIFYLNIFGHRDIVALAVVSAILALIFFSIIRFFGESQEKSRKEKFLPV